MFVLFQALMNPTRLILGVEAATTPGGMLSDAAESDVRDRNASAKTQNLLLGMAKPLFLHVSSIYPCTTMLPDIEGTWNLQWNGNIPAWFAFTVMFALWIGLWSVGCAATITSFAYGEPMVKVWF